MIFSKRCMKQMILSTESEVAGSQTVVVLIVFLLTSCIARWIACSRLRAFSEMIMPFRTIVLCSTYLMEISGSVCNMRLSAVHVKFVSITSKILNNIKIILKVQTCRKSKPADLIATMQSSKAIPMLIGTTPWSSSLMTDLPIPSSGIDPACYLLIATLQAFIVW